MRAWPKLVGIFGNKAKSQSTAHTVVTRRLVNNLQLEFSLHFHLCLRYIFPASSSEVFYMAALTLSIPDDRQ